VDIDLSHTEASMRSVTGGRDAFGHKYARELEVFSLSLSLIL
jgi:hypothetical protein